MTPATETLLIQAMVALVIAVFTAWLTVRLSLRRFRQERMWDRKAAAYERAIEALHNAKRFSSEHLDAYYKGKELEDEKADNLRKLSREARDEIRRAAEIGSFILSDQALGIIKTYENEIADTKELTMWQDYLDHDYGVTDKCLKQFIVEAKRDLTR